MCIIGIILKNYETIFQLQNFSIGIGVFTTTAS